MVSTTEKTSSMKNYQLIHAKNWSVDGQLSTLVKGILLQPSDDIKSLALILNQAPLIAVDFSNFDDGRSYSQVKLLRKLINYTGEIKALNVHIDHLQFIFRAGVDSYELLPEYQKYHSSYAMDFSVCYQVAQNDTGLIQKYKTLKV